MVIYHRHDRGFQLHRAELYEFILIYRLFFLLLGAMMGLIGIGAG